MRAFCLLTEINRETVKIKMVMFKTMWSSAMIKTDD